MEEGGVKIKNLVGLLAVLMLLIGVFVAATVMAELVEPHLGEAWSDQAVWGIKLTWENSPYGGSA